MIFYDWKHILFLCLPPPPIQSLHVMLSPDQHICWIPTSQAPSAQLWLGSTESHFLLWWQPFCGLVASNFSSLDNRHLHTVNFSLSRVRFGSESHGNSHLQSCSSWTILVRLSLWRCHTQRSAQPALVSESEEITGFPAQCQVVLLAHFFFGCCFLFLFLFSWPWCRSALLLRKH